MDESDSDIVEDACDHCQAQATLFCSQCKCSYCSTCSSVGHRVDKRKDHILLRISSVGDTVKVITAEPSLNKTTKKVNQSIKFHCSMIFNVHDVLHDNV